MEFEDVLEATGGFGRYQKLLCFILVPFSSGLCALVYYAQLVALAVPPHRCISGASAALQNSSAAATTTTTAPSDEPWPKETACFAFPHNYTEDPTPCTAWEFDYTNLFPTAASQNEWVCDNAWRPYTLLTVFWMGNMIGAWILGMMSDRYGRRPVVIICAGVYAVFGIASVFVTDFYGFLVLRTMVGTVHHTIAHLPFVLVMEYCLAKSRVMPLMAMMVSYTLGSMLTCALAYFIWDWQVLLFVSAAPAVLLCIGCKWVPESSSWLVTQGRMDAAMKQLHYIASVNNENLSEDEVARLLRRMTASENKQLLADTDNAPYDDKTAAMQLQHSGSNEPTTEMIWSVFKYPILRRDIITIMFIWMVVYMCYYGHTQNTANLGNNILVSYLLGSAMEIPAWTAPWLIERYGRRVPLIIALSVSGAAGIAYFALVFVGVGWLSTGMGLFGRLTVTGAYFMALQYGPEIFPTVVRGQGVAMAETLGGVAIFLSPAVVYLAEVFPGMPLLVFGVLACAAGGVTILLPETKGVSLPNTLQQAEEQGRRRRRKQLPPTTGSPDILA